MEFAITQSKWSDCHETKSKHIDITLGLKCDHQILPWPWPWPLIFKVKYWICYISAKNYPIAMKCKANILFNLKATSVAIRFHFGHELDLEFSRSNMEFAVSQPKMARLPRNEKRPWTCDRWGDRGDFICLRADDSSSYVHGNSFLRDVVTNPWHNFNNDLAKPPSKLEHYLNQCWLI